MRKDKIRRFSASLMRHLFGDQPERPVFEGELRSIVILAQEKIGDAILLTPLIKNLRHSFPHVKIHVMAFGPIYEFFERDPNVDVVYQVKGRARAFLAEARKVRFDVLFNTKDHPSWTFLMHGGLLRARYKVGIDHPNHRGLFNHLIRLEFQQHIVDKNCALLKYLGAKFTEEDCRPYIPPYTASEDVRKFVRENSGKSLIGINLSAGEPAREWPIEKWIGLLEKVKQPIVVFAMPDRQSEKERLESLFDYVLKSPPTKSIYDVAAIIQTLVLLVSPDTSLIHIASCYKRLVVGLYRADVIHRTRFAPYRIPNCQVVSKTSMVADIPLEDVLAAIEELCPHITIT
ncbi:MAG: glycosyltransferase family 9 protein [Chlorobiales bacterium]|nr:glycosyltransferase family 9 protein [Chlorobiales bacterium]